MRESTPGPFDGSGGSPISPGLLKGEIGESGAVLVGASPQSTALVDFVDLKASAGDGHGGGEHPVHRQAAGIVRIAVHFQGLVQDQDHPGAEAELDGLFFRAGAGVVARDDLGVLDGVGAVGQRVGFLLHGRGVAVELGEGCVDFGVVCVEISA